MKTTNGLALAGAILGVASLAAPAKAAIVINEVYPGGGASTGSPAYRTDFIELYNSGPAGVDISNYRLDYGAAASAAGTFASAVGVIPSGTTLPAGGYYLIQTGSSGSAGATDVTPDADFGATSLAQASGGLRLSDASTNILDVVGWGSVNNFEGTAETSPSSTAVSIQRIPDGLDTNNNAADFQQATPTPRAANGVPEPGTLGVVGVGLAMLAARRRHKG